MVAVVVVAELLAAIAVESLSGSTVTTRGKSAWKRREIQSGTSPHLRKGKSGWDAARVADRSRDGVSSPDA